MPSYQARLTRALVRINTALVPSFSPVGYQRFMISEVAPRIASGGESCDLENAVDCTVPASWVVPRSAADDGVILYLHGGGYVIGSIKSHRKMVEQIAEAAGCRALIIDYRLAPECEFPGAVEDAAAAYRWLMSTGYSPENIVIAGDSAGGGLTVAALVSLRDSGEPLPAAAVLLSPWTDLQVVGGSASSNARRDPMLDVNGLRVWAGMYAGSHDPRAPLASPIHAELTGLPPMLIQVGSYEILLDDARRLADRAERDGVPVDLEVWEGMWHVWQFFSPRVPESAEAIARIGEYCREKLA